QPISFKKSKNMEESKMFFIGLAEKDVRIKVLQSFLDELQQEKGKLLSIEAIIVGLPDDPIESNVKRYEVDAEAKQRLSRYFKDRTLHDTVSDIYKYQMATLRYSLMEVDFQISYYQNLLNTELKK